MASPRLRVSRVYATTARVLASYAWLRLWRPFISAERYAALLERRNRANARRVHDAIVRAGGLFIKVGQLISILTNFLPPEFRKELEGLQDSLPPRAYDEIAARIRAEFGRGPEEVFVEFDRVPIATASLAQVHAATLADGRRVAVKVQHADIERIATIDLEVIRRVLRVVQWFSNVRGIEGYHPEISAMIREELDFTREAENIDRIARNFAGDRRVRCPVVVPALSTRHVLTTEFIDGIKVTDFGALSASGQTRREVAEHIVAAYCRMIFVDGVYHADPHPGNIFVGRDGGIVFVDFGAVGVLAPHMREGIPAFFDGVIRRDRERIMGAIRTMGFVARDMARTDIPDRVIGYFQRQLFNQLTDADWSLGDMQVDMRARLDTLADLRRLDVSFRQLTTTFQVPKDWVLLERTILLLLGLCTELDASFNPMVVIRPYLEDVVFGKGNNWMDTIRKVFTEMTRTAVTLPQDMQRAAARVNDGELEIRVPEIMDAARFLYASVHQLIYCILGVSAGVIAYQAYDRERLGLAIVTTIGAGVAFVALIVSMRRDGPRR